MAKPPKTAAAVHANRGVEARYRRDLQRLIAEMQGSVEYWLAAGYKKNPPLMAELVAQDAAPSKAMQRIVNGLAKRWIKKFSDAAPKIADSYLKSMYKTTDAAFQKSLKDAGWAVEFTMTPVVRDAFAASLEANVGLIKSIPEKYLQQVEGVVMRSYSTGRDLATMTKELRALYPITNRRAAFIALDQSNKANAVVQQARQLELGIKEAIWLHSGGGRHPRPEHVKAGKEKRRFNIAEGCLIDGKKILPGQEINCRCVSRVILPF